MRLDFTPEQLEQFEPKIQEAILRLYRQQNPPPPGPAPQPELKVVDYKSPEDLEKEWRDHYKDGRFETPAY